MTVTASSDLEGAEVCTQAWCALRDTDRREDLVIESVLRSLAGEETTDLLPAELRIARRQVCGECLRRVLRGGHVLSTPAEQDALRRAGRWSQRRQRRYGAGA